MQEWPAWLDGQHPDDGGSRDGTEQIKAKVSCMARALIEQVVGMSGFMAKHPRSLMFQGQQNMHSTKAGKHRQEL